MTQEERWVAKYNEVVKFIEMNKRNPSKYVDEERGKYYNWIRHNRKLFKIRRLKPEREEKFKNLMELCERYKRNNQYE